MDDTDPCVLYLPALAFTNMIGIVSSKYPLHLAANFCSHVAQIDLINK